MPRRAILYRFIFSVLLPCELLAAETPAAAVDPVLPNIITPGRPHGQRDPHRELSSDTLIQIALQHKREGRPHEAINTLSNALMRDAKHAQLYAVRGSLYLEQGQITDALRDLESALRLNPDDAMALTNRSQAYRRFGRPLEALADIERAVTLEPDLVAARFNRGVMRYENDDMQGALQDFDHCIAIDPHAPAPYFNRAGVYDALGQRDAAVTDIRRFMELTQNAAWKKSAQDLLDAWAGKAQATAAPSQ
jgi:tetratricopeptide (TPR) repeat protein